MLVTAALAVSGLVVGPAASPAVADTAARACLLEAVAPDGAVLGYLAHDERGVVVSRDEALSHRFVLTAGTQQNLEDLNAFGRSLGLTAQAGGQSLRVGSPANAFVSITFPTEPGAIPAGDDNTGQSSERWESAVWEVAEVGDVAPTWINPDGTAAPTRLFLQAPNVGVTGDIDALNSAYAVSATPVALRTALCKGVQEITFTSALPQRGYIGQTYPVTATGGGSANPVTFTSGRPSVCEVADGTVTFRATGTCTIHADQAGSEGYLAARRTSQQVQVDRIASRITMSAPARALYGQQVTVTSLVTVDAGAPAGKVTISIDDLLRPGVYVRTNGSAAPISIFLSVGDHAITTTFIPDDETAYSRSQTTGAITIARAASATAVAAVGESLVAHVTAVSPSTGLPHGTVTFGVDGDVVGAGAVDQGVATLSWPLVHGEGHRITAEYSGDTDYAGSSASTTRNDPMISAQLASATPTNSRGWYRNRVTVRFVCTENGAPLVGGACPAPVSLGRDGAGRTVSRTISATDGGIATVTARVSLDRTAPVVRVVGPRSGAHYARSAPAAHCSANDATSGMLSCRVSTSHRSGGGSR